MANKARYLDKYLDALIDAADTLPGLYNELIAITYVSPEDMTDIDLGVIENAIQLLPPEEFTVRETLEELYTMYVGRV